MISELRQLGIRQLPRRLGGHLPLEHAPHGDEVVEQRHVVVVVECDAEHVGVEEVPRAARLHRRPAALLDAHEAALLEELQTLPDDRPAEPELVA